MKIAILLPYKETYSKIGAGAVSILVSSHLKNSIYKKSTKIYGSMTTDPMSAGNFKPLLSGNYFRNRSYVQSFSKELCADTNLIEIHNRPEYFFYLKKKFPYKKFTLFFHNDPQQLRGSKTKKERDFIYNNCDKIIFLSLWIKNQFVFTGIPEQGSKLVVFYPGIDKIKNFPKKKKRLVVFVGKLNAEKGYNIYIDAIDKFLSEFKNWKSISIGNEVRRVIPASKNTVELGYLSHKKVLKIYEKSSIAIANSVRNEPLGRLPMEASSRGCLPIVSNRGGLPETLNANSIVLKKNTSQEIYSELSKLALDEKRLLSKQKLIFNNFKYHLTNQVKILDDIRSNYLPKPNLKKLKIIHITNLNERFDGRLHYNSGKRITNGFTRLGHNVLSISDRDFLHLNKSLFDLSGSKKFNQKIINSHLNFKADLIILGHADSITVKTIEILKSINKAKVCQWFLDPLVPKGPDYKKNRDRISKLSNSIDATFLTTAPEALKFKTKNFYYIPNPVDSSFERLSIYKLKPTTDLFFAMSHGVHRGILKKGKFDDRQKFLEELKSRAKDVTFAIFGMNDIQPIWGENFFKELSNCSMALNLSRGPTFKYYSSDRLAQLMGNGLLTFVDNKTKLYEIINKNEVVFYTNTDDLIKKIIFYKKNPKKRIQISKNGQTASFKRFNSNVVSQYIINKTFNLKITKKFSWQV
mgnify:FL=1